MTEPQLKDFKAVIRYHFDDIKAYTGYSDFPSDEVIRKASESFVQTPRGGFIPVRIAAGSIDPQFLSLGASTLVMHGNKFGPGVEVGENCFIGTDNEFHSGTVLEDGVKVGSHNFLDIGTRLRKN